MIQSVSPVGGNLTQPLGPPQGVTRSPSCVETNALSACRSPARALNNGIYGILGVVESTGYDEELEFCPYVGMFTGSGFDVVLMDYTSPPMRHGLHF